MIKFLQRLLGGNPGPSEPEVAAREHYKGFDLSAAPIREGAAWRVAGSIVKDMEGVPKQHEFVRADTYPNRDDAIATSLQKARLLVDERGDGLFKK